MLPSQDTLDRVSPCAGVYVGGYLILILHILSEKYKYQTLMKARLFSMTKLRIRVCATQSIADKDLYKYWTAQSLHFESSEVMTRNQRV